jgi:hypothetical protein
MDLDVIKQRLEALSKPASNKGGNNEKSLFWKPSVGKQTIRIVPSKFNSKTPFSELYFYYGIGKPVMISPVSWGDQDNDPIYDFAKNKLRKSTNPEHWKLAKKLEPKVRYFAPVIVRGEEDKGVRLWQFGKELYSAFLQMAVDEEVGDYTDIVNGRDIKLTTEGPEVTGTKYNRTIAAPSMKNSNLGEAEQVEKWLQDQANPVDVFKRHSSEEMEEALREWIASFDETPSSEGDIIDDEKEIESAPQTNYSINTSVAAVKQTKLDKFDSLFDEEEAGDLPWEK